MGLLSEVYYLSQVGVQPLNAEVSGIRSSFFFPFSINILSVSVSVYLPAVSLFLSLSVGLSLSLPLPHFVLSLIHGLR